jgi:microcin C transport system substrate-binding protein
MKDGKPLRIRYLSRGSSDDRFTAIFQEDLKNVGIAIDVAKKDWAAWAKDMDDYNFDMTWAAWSAGLFKNPESMWLSSEGARPGGQNITGFQNEQVDAWIAEQRAIFDVQTRHDIVRKIDSILVSQFPYILLWNKDEIRLLYWNKFGMPSNVLGKYGDERAAYQYWWADPDAAADLAHAMSTDRPLPPKPAAVDYTPPPESGRE